MFFLNKRLLIDRREKHILSLFNDVKHSSARQKALVLGSIIKVLYVYNVLENKCWKKCYILEL